MLHLVHQDLLYHELGQTVLAITLIQIKGAVSVQNQRLLVEQFKKLKIK